MVQICGIKKKKILALNTSISKSLNTYFLAELNLYKEALSKQNFATAWKHLERAHVIGQSYPIAHSKVHWLMLKFGFKTKNTKEIIGQLPRLFFGGVKSFVGVIPVGNTGGANVPPLKPLPINKDIQAIFHLAGVQQNNKK